MPICTSLFIAQHSIQRSSQGGRIMGIDGHAADCAVLRNQGFALAGISETTRGSPRRAASSRARLCPSKGWVGQRHPLVRAIEGFLPILLSVKPDPIR